MMQSKDRVRLNQLLQMFQNTISGDDTDLQNSAELIKDQLYAWANRCEREFPGNPDDGRMCRSNGREYYTE